MVWNVTGPKHTTVLYLLNAPTLPLLLNGSLSLSQCYVESCVDRTLCNFSNLGTKAVQVGKANLFYKVLNPVNITFCRIERVQCNKLAKKGIISLFERYTFQRLRVEGLVFVMAGCSLNNGSNWIIFCEQDACRCILCSLHPCHSDYFISSPIVPARVADDRAWLMSSNRIILTTQFFGVFSMANPFRWLLT